MSLPFDYVTAPCDTPNQTLGGLWPQGAKVYIQNMEIQFIDIMYSDYAAATYSISCH